ncbi:hypothetical protein B566_EDAN016215 [Ephemera danica]|nr:hypothetical protein B566_EDAN016215 [Ephemera danica]
MWVPFHLLSCGLWEAVKRSLGLGGWLRGPPIRQGQQRRVGVHEVDNSRRSLSSWLRITDDNSSYSCRDVGIRSTAVDTLIKLLNFSRWAAWLQRCVCGAANRTVTYNDADSENTSRR